MASEKRETDKYYKYGIFYFDHTTKRIFVPDPYINRINLNFANKWSYLIFALLIIIAIACVAGRWLSHD